jgi:quercetin dioxygenase-like cupin family protein
MLDRASSETVHLLGNILTFHIRPSIDGSAFLLSECKTAPGAGAPPNTHPEDEAFYVLDGTVEFSVEGKTSVYGPGSLIVIPNNGVHAFRNVGEKPSRILILNWPGNDHERFFREAGELLPSGVSDFPQNPPPPQPEKIMAIGAKHNMTFLPPPGH